MILQFKVFIMTHRLSKNFNQCFEEDCLFSIQNSCVLSLLGQGNEVESYQNFTGCEQRGNFN